MLINVVTGGSGWILQKIAERIVAAAPTGIRMRLSSTPWHGGNNFYVDVQNCFHWKMGGIDIGLFTHVHENDIKHLQPHWFTLDHVIHMSYRNSQLWDSDPRHNKEKQSTSIKLPGEIPSGFEFRKRRVGIAQRGKYEGKGFHFMMELIENCSEVVELFDWLFIGNDWDEVVTELSKLTKVDVIKDSDAAWPSEYNRFYSEIDYLLIPSKWEGGPMGLLEAAAAGVPVISAKVGWADLSQILYRIGHSQRMAYDVVKSLSYADYASHVVDCFKLVEERNARTH
jgi:glycosyltransferase involved in cell wall biosynthesis